MMYCIECNFNGIKGVIHTPTDSNFLADVLAMAARAESKFMINQIRITQPLTQGDR